MASPGRSVGQYAVKCTIRACGQRRYLRNTLPPNRCQDKEASCVPLSLYCLASSEAVARNAPAFTGWRRSGMLVFTQ
jgi:hypothetical protein